MGVHVFSILNIPPTSLPIPIPQGHPRTLALSTLSHASNLDRQSISHMIIYMFQCYSLNHPTLAFSHRVQKSVLHICVSWFFSFDYITNCRAQLGFFSAHMNIMNLPYYNQTILHSQLLEPSSHGFC